MATASTDDFGVRTLRSELRKLLRSLVLGRSIIVSHAP
jgi:hypothetical protein